MNKYTLVLITLMAANGSVSAKQSAVSDPYVAPYEQTIPASITSNKNNKSNNGNHQCGGNNGNGGGNNCVVDVPAPVPVPAALWLMGSGLIGLMGVVRSKKSSKL